MFFDNLLEFTFQILAIVISLIRSGQVWKTILKLLNHNAFLSWKVYNYILKRLLKLDHTPTCPVLDVYDSLSLVSMVINEHLSGRPAVHSGNSATGRLGHE